LAWSVADHLRGEVVHPLGIAHADASPFVRGALGEALEVDELVVDVDATGARAALELGLAEAGRRS
jgi:hypothetical protein